MTADDFRELALSLPDATEASHMNHPDFRVTNKVFATLAYPDDAHAVVILPLDQQAKFVAAAPKTYAVVKGFWGRRGATQIRLQTATRANLRAALAMAWRRVAPKRLQIS
ncbi:MAG: MmcQ/YjbR family DNA-binding protein [Chthoniobacterales bacterium]